MVGYTEHARTEVAMKTVGLLDTLSAFLRESSSSYTVGNAFGLNEIFQVDITLPLPHGVSLIEYHTGIVTYCYIVLL